MFDDDLAWALASGIRFEWDDDERELLAPLVDAAIMRANGDELARPVVAALWDGLRPLIADELREQAQRDPFVAEVLEDALADLELGPTRGRVAACVVQQAALDLADHVFFLEECLDCIEDGLTHAPSRTHVVLLDRAVAVLALHGDEDFGATPPTNAERCAVRRKIARLAQLGREGLPRLSSELERIAAMPLPPLEDDRIVRAVVTRRLAADAHLI